MIRMLLALSMVLLSGAAAFGQVLDFVPEHAPRSVAISSDDALLAVGDASGNITIFSIGDGKEKKSLRWQQTGDSNGVARYTEVKCLAFLPDGERLVAPGGYPHFLNVWDTTTWQHVVGDATPARHDAYEIKLSERGEVWLYTRDPSSRDTRRVVVCNAADALVGMPGLYDSLEVRAASDAAETSVFSHRALSPGGSILAVAGNSFDGVPVGTVEFRRLSGTESATHDFLQQLPDKVLQIGMKHVDKIAWSPDAKYLAVSGYKSAQLRRNKWQPQDARLALFDLSDGGERYDLITGRGKVDDPSGHIERTRDIIFSRSGRYLAAVRPEEKSVRVFKIDDVSILQLALRR